MTVHGGRLIGGLSTVLLLLLLLSAAAAPAGQSVAWSGWRGTSSARRGWRWYESCTKSVNACTVGSLQGACVVISVSRFDATVSRSCTSRGGAAEEEAESVNSPSVSRRLPSILSVYGVNYGKLR